MPPGLRCRVRRGAVIAGASLVVLLGACRAPRTGAPAAAVPPPPAAGGIALVAHAELPTGLRLGPFEVGGLSGLAYDGAADLFYAVVDDPSDHPPPRVLRFRWHPPAAPVLVDWLLLSEQGYPLPPVGADLEGIVREDDGTLFISSEGDVHLGIGPWVGRFDPHGELVGRLPLPDTFIPAKGRGPHHNQGFEALTLVGEDALLAGTEGPLLQDQPPPAGELERCRLLRWDLRRRSLPAQWLYPLDPPHAPATEPNGLRVAGLVDLLPWDGRLLALERSFVTGAGTAIKLYETTLAGAREVGADKAFAGRRAPTLRKRLLLDLATLGAPIDNYEAMSWLPMAGGKRMLVMISDNNFSPTQQTYLLALTLEAPPAWPPLAGSPN